MPIFRHILQSSPKPPDSYVTDEEISNQDLTVATGGLETELRQLVISTLSLNHLTMCLTPKLRERSHWLVKI